MTITKHAPITLLPVFCTLFLLVGCSDYWQANKTDVAKSFVRAINQNDTNKIVKLTATPLSIRNQEWESAPDGKGFLLGKSKDEYLTDKAQIET